MRILEDSVVHLAHKLWIHFNFWRSTMTLCFTRGQFVGVRDMKNGKVYRAKVVDDEKHSMKVHYVD